MLRGVIAPNGYCSVFSIYYFNGKGTLKSVQTSTLVKNIFTMNLISANVELNINELMSYYGIRTFQDFADKIGVSKQLIGNWKRQNTYDVHKIMYAFPEVRREWLVFGEGDMLKSDTSAPVGLQHVEASVPILPYPAAAGYGDDAFGVRLEDITDRVTLATLSSQRPDFLLYVRGDSMSPTIAHGELVSCALVRNGSITWGGVYALDTVNNGLLIKRVDVGDTPDSVTIISDNKAYRQYQLQRDEIRGVAKVLKRIGDVV